MKLSRRAACSGIASSFPFLASGLALGQSGIRLLDPAKVASWYTKMNSPAHKRVHGKDGWIRYADEGAQTAPVILYFHGISSPYRASIPLEYPLIEAGYRIVMPNRPGYEGTDDAYDCSAGGIADMALELLALLKIKGPVLVMGVSAGGPAALAFASAHASLTKALILHSAVAHTWSETKFVPVYLQDAFDKAEILGLGKAFFGASAEVNAFAHNVFGTKVPEPSYDTEVIGKDQLEAAKKDPHLRWSRKY